MMRAGDEPQQVVPDVEDGAEQVGRRPRRVAAGILAVLVLAFVVLAVLAIVRNVLGGGQGGRSANEPVSAPVETPQPPIPPPIPNVIGRSRADALASLEASGFSVWMFSAREHANMPVVTTETAAAGTRVTAVVGLPNRFPVPSGEPVVLVALGSPKPFPGLPGTPTPWWFVHGETVVRGGPVVCTRCHTTRECTECHVKLARGQPTGSAVDPGATRDAVARIIGERTAAGAILIRNVTVSRGGTCSIDLNADARATDGPVAQADAVTLQIMQGVRMSDLRVGELMLRWFLPLNAEPFLVVRVTAIRAGRTKWKSMEATQVPDAVDSYTLDTPRLP